MIRSFLSLGVAIALTLPIAASARKTGVRLVFFAEAPSGKNAAERADEPINPASVIKVATTLWALERLGPDHRFETTFGIRGELDRETGVLQGDLIVVGGGDPDFHVENAWLVARELNRLGLREVRGSVRVDERFWIGWEGGSDRREKDPDRRVREMAVRLRDALDPERWSRGTKRSIEEFLVRRDRQGEAIPRIVIRGGADRSTTPPETVLVSHRSNPLRRTLKRFNAYSNNDIERLEIHLGPPSALESFLVERLDVPRSEIRIETLSGLGSNRLSPRRIVSLLRDLRTTGSRLDLTEGDLLPVSGCDEGTLESFPRLADPAGTLVAKTGTLSNTDGGVAALAGFARTRNGTIPFCVAAPGIGGAIARAREAQQTWVVDLLNRHGGARASGCGAEIGFSDDDAQVREVGGSSASPS